MKSFKQTLLLNESPGRVLISVDIQPAYVDAMPFTASEWISWMEGADYDDNIIMFNGPELGFPDENEYKYWLYENGMTEEFMDSCTFIDKTYAFFRSCMDEGLAEDLEILVAYMYKNDINDSRDMEEDNWADIEMDEDTKDYLINSGEMISIPDLMSDLESLGNNIDVVGGGTNECLEEIRIALRALNKGFRDINEWIY